MRIVVIQFDADKGLGLLERPLHRIGLTIDPRLAPTDPVALDDVDGLIVLGALANPDDADPAVTAATATLADALSLGIPILGICLGAELLARAAGAPTPVCEPEYGFHDVELDPAAATDPLLASLPERFRVFQAHAYTWELPTGAVLLARSAHTRQAFRIGSCAWGLQFHFEPDAAMIDQWTSHPAVAATLRSNSIDRAALLIQARSDTLPWIERAASIAERFASVIRPDARVA